ncbi:MAG: hypothetical protein ACJ72L_12510 [Marmoricola sp.]
MTTLSSHPDTSEAGLWGCEECHAQVPQAHRLEHIRWHDTLRTRMRQLEHASRALEARLRRA